MEKVTVGIVTRENVAVATQPKAASGEMYGIKLYGFFSQVGEHNRCGSIADCRSLWDPHHRQQL